jgi:hypothetical protein
VAERCPGHKLRGIEETYDRHDYFKKRRAALEQWTTFVVQVERGERHVVSNGADPYAAGQPLHRDHL